MNKQKPDGDAFDESALDDRELFARLLQYCGKNASGGAVERLFGRCPDIVSLLSDDISELEELCGKNGALLLSSLPSLFRYVSLEERRTGAGIEGVIARLARQFIGRRAETALLVTLDTGRGEVSAVGYHELARGSLGSVAADIRSIAELCVADGSTVFMLAHNHPQIRRGGRVDASEDISGVSPSSQDTAATGYIQSASRELGLTLAEHVIISGLSYHMMLAGRSGALSGYAVSPALKG